MLPSRWDEQFTPFHHAAYASGALDEETEILIGAAASRRRDLPA